jgi:hypothetical protein|tara:strand:+ start:2272 stop:2682 length:411 start_codon:yes stop_codon:yes gene_type:complete
MQLLSILLLQFIYIYLSIIIGVPGTDKINLLKNKIILFSGIFIFELIINSFNKNYNNNNIFYDSIFFAILSIVGYSFYIDLSIMDNTKSLFQKINSDLNLNAITISLIISILILVFKTFKLLTQSSKKECNNKYTF